MFTRKKNYAEYAHQMKLTRKIRTKVCGRPALVCTGVIQAQAAVCAMFDEPPDQTPDEFPLAMWTTPECAYYGQTLAAATKQAMFVLTPS